MRLLKAISALSLVSATALVALSPLVRITGSGMGCGDDWPLCNGRLIPPLDNPAVMIEWGHRLSAAGVGVLVIAMALLAWVSRRKEGVGGPAGVLRPALLGGVLLVTQILLGAVTVWLELPAGVVVLHMTNALALLAVIGVGTFRAFSSGGALPGASPGAYRTAMVAAGLGAVALLLGALTANLDAGMACTGFPLCGGALWPSGGLTQLQWAHRLVAYALVLHFVGVLTAGHRRHEPSGVLLAAWGVATLLAGHVAVAALMVHQRLPLPLRGAHAAIGALLWVGLVYLAWRSAPRTTA